MTTRGVTLAWAWIAAVVACSAAADGTGDSPDAQVAAAIGSLRGHSSAHLSADEYGALGKTLDAAWEVLTEHPRPAKKAIREVLMKEREDWFLVIDLAHLFAMMEDDQASLMLAASAIERADLRVHPSGTFHALSMMASHGCGPCLPAVLRILELKDPATYIAQHALPIDVDLGIVFTLGQYGDAAIPGVEAALASAQCVVRSNAARALALLLPDRLPGALRGMAAADSCTEARVQAWLALGELDDPALPALAGERRAATPPPERDERLAMVHGLASSFSPAALPFLDLMSTDPDAEVAEAAVEGAKGLRSVRPMMDRLGAQHRKGTQPSGHTKLVRALEQGEKDGRYEVEEKRDEFISRLVPDDITLLNRVRAAVLVRLSDESLYEYYPLTYVVRALRSLRAASPPAPDPPPAVPDHGGAKPVDPPSVNR